MATHTSQDVFRLTSFTVGDWLVEPKACRVTRGETVVKLRPQLAELLVCLARRAGEVVLKDEILAEVWPGQFIAESGLSRCVAELRQSLQDDVHEPRFIETFPKRGYRLIAPVVWLEEAAPAGIATERPPGADLAGAPPVAGGREPAHAGQKGWRAVAWARRMWVPAVALLAIGLIWATLLWRSPASALTDRDMVLIADVRNATRDSVFDDTLRLALAVNLAQAPFLRILPQEAVRAAVARTGRSPDERLVGPLALDVCRREGASVLLAGSIAPLGSRYAVGIEAVACGTGEEIGRTLAEADDKEHVLAALEQAATRIRQRLGESRASLSQHGVPLVRATTPSLEALKALTLGDHNRDHARLEDALAYYRRATDLDAGFALAWARRGAAARNLDLLEEAIPALRRAYELRDRVTAPEGFYIAAAYYRIVAGDPQKAIETYQAWKRMYPGSAVPPTNLASIFTGWMGNYDAAVTEGHEAVALAPYSSLAYNNLVVACLGAGRIAEARKSIQEAVSRGVDDRLIHERRLSLALFDGDRAAIEREVRWASGDPLAALRALRLRASVAVTAGRLHEARRLWSEAVATAQEMGPPRRVAAVRLDQARGEALLGDAGAARLAVQAGLAADTGTTTRALSSIVLELVGEAARARALLGDIDPQSGLAPETLRVWLPVARALAAAAQGDADAALGILRPVGPFERGSAFELVPLGARALVERRAHRPSEAAAAFRELIRLGVNDPSFPWVPFARLELARALRDSGDTAQSVAAYDAFLASWKDADADAPLLEVARRERATALR